MKGLHESGNVHEVKAGLDPKYSKKIVQFFDELEGRSEYNIPSHPVRETTREDYQDALRNELISAGANRNRIAHFVESLNSESWESAGSRLKKAEGIRGVKISEYFKMSNPDLVEVSTIQQDDLDAMLLHFCALRDELIRLYFELHHSMNSWFLQLSFIWNQFMIEHNMPDDCIH